MSDLPTGSLPAVSGNAERLWTPQFVLLLLSAVFMYLMTFMLTPTLPLYAEDIGAGSSSAAGLIVALYTVGALLPRLLWGRLADGWGRQPVYLIGVALMAVLSPLYPVFAVLPAILVLRLVQGVGFSAASTAAATMAADLVPATRRAEGIGYYALANTLGMALGPNLGLVLHQSAGAGWLFLVSAGGGLLAFAIGCALRYERRMRGRARGPATGSGSRARDAARPRSTAAVAVPAVGTGEPTGRRHGVVETSVLPVCLVFLFVVMPYGATMAFIAVYGLDQGVTEIGLYFTVFAVALFLVRLGVGRLTDRFGVTAAFVPAVVFMLAGLLVLGWADGLVLFLVSAVLFGFGYGIALPILQALVYRFAPRARRGAASATFLATADIAYGAGAIVLGVLAGLLGYPVAFVSLSVFTLVALVLFVALVRPRVHDGTADGASGA